MMQLNNRKGGIEITAEIMVKLKQKYPDTKEVQIIDMSVDYEAHEQTS
jgi:hypothetical protein